MNLYSICSKAQSWSSLLSDSWYFVKVALKTLRGIEDYRRMQHYATLQNGHVSGRPGPDLAHHGAATNQFELSAAPGACHKWNAKGIVEVRDTSTHWQQDTIH